MSLSRIPHETYTHSIFLFPIYSPTKTISTINAALPPSLHLPSDLLPLHHFDPSSYARGPSTGSSISYELVYIGYCIDHAESTTKHGVIGFMVVGEGEEEEDGEKVVKAFAPGRSLWEVVRGMVLEGVVGRYRVVEKGEEEHKRVYEAVMGKLGE